MGSSTTRKVFSSSSSQGGAEEVNTLLESADKSSVKVGVGRGFVRKLLSVMQNMQNGYNTVMGPWASHYSKSEVVDKMPTPGEQQERGDEPNSPAPGAGRRGLFRAGVQYTPATHHPANNNAPPNNTRSTATADALRQLQDQWKRQETPQSWPDLQFMAKAHGEGVSGGGCGGCSSPAAEEEDHEIMSGPYSLSPAARRPKFFGKNQNQGTPASAKNDQKEQNKEMKPGHYILKVLQVYMSFRKLQQFDSVTIVGHSLGGACALMTHAFAWLSRDLPEKVRASAAVLLGMVHHRKQIEHRQAKCTCSRQ
ncbi:unnamed protein product [Amoebophrya sp. A120]|nr:unnamed protein product [Amoebophrya sp. A120]|eukprot:GSA120T00017874001.1